ncbi:MAG: Response regulator receiver domain protein [Spirochaetes bacterium]|nr:MAG: Response regulator receiver domain protein [Spirochaetota bacterium]
MSGNRVLIIEDDKSIQNLLRISLKASGFSCELTDTGLSGLSLALANNPDIILLDLGLPDIDGVEVLSQLRERSNTPVIVISARDQEKEKVSALDSGADDYITKPFNIPELLARVRVALRHVAPRESAPSVFSVGGLSIDFERHQVTVDGIEVHLTPLEFKMLSLLAEHSGKVLTHQFIQKKVWGYDTTDGYQSLRVFMANIRRKIEPETSNPLYILTEIGIGYRMVEG